MVKGHFMRELPQSMIVRWLLALMVSAPLHAQIARNPQAATNPAVPSTKPAGQAPDEVMKKLSDLVHAGKYAEAQQLTTGLLVAYPDDQRLIKAKALLDRSLASSKPTDPAASSNPPTGNVAAALLAENTKATQLTGMEKVDYSALIELASQAQQTTDLLQQRKLLKQFMAQSSVFVQNHPNQMLLWQLRAASAISLNYPMLGYEAGQKLLALGAADANDQNLQSLLGQLKNKGWLDKQGVEDAQQYAWLSGTWSATTSFTWPKRGNRDHEPAVTGGDFGDLVFSKSDSGEILVIQSGGPMDGKLFFRGTILKSEEIKWETNLSLYDGTYPTGWQPIISWEVASNKSTMKILTPSKWDTEKDSKNYSQQNPITYSLTKISDSQVQ
jgi:hypothetical protein